MVLLDCRCPKKKLSKIDIAAGSCLTSMPGELLDAAWQDADHYARTKYGEDYAEIKGFSRYGAALDVYARK